MSITNQPLTNCQRRCGVERGRGVWKKSGMLGEKGNSPNLADLSVHRHNYPRLLGYGPLVWKIELKLGSGVVKHSK